MITDQIELRSVVNAAAFKRRVVFEHDSKIPKLELGCLHIGCRNPSRSSQASSNRELGPNVSAVTASEIELCEAIGVRYGVVHILILHAPFMLLASLIFTDEIVSVESTSSRMTSLYVIDTTVIRIA